MDFIMSNITTNPATINNESPMVKLVSPWIDYYRCIQAMFIEDPEVTVKFDEDDCAIKIYVDNNVDKYEALCALIAPEKQFGNVTVKVRIYPSNKLKASTTDLFNNAFMGNPAVKDIINVNVFGNDMNYVVFKNKVVQYFNDDIGDVNGIRSTLYQDIAKDLFEAKGVYFCTEAGDDVIKG